MKKKIKNIVNKIFLRCKINDIIILESHADFSDSTKVLYDYLIKTNKLNKYKVFWFVQDSKRFKHLKRNNVKFVKIWDKNNKRSLFGIIKYIYFIKNAKFIIYANRSMPKININSKAIYLTHGTPFKKVRDLVMLSNDTDYVLASSNFCANIISEQYNVPPKKILTMGLLRNDLFFSTNSDIKKRILEKKNDNKLLIWLPTFRKHKTSERNDSSFSFPLGLPIIYNYDDLKKINKILADKKIVILLKPHPAQDSSIIKEFNFSHLILIDDKFLFKKDIQLYELLAVSDGMITDYSSVFYDYLMMDKPMAFTVDDIEQYSKKKGFIYSDPLNHLPGTKLYVVNDMIQFINDFSKGIDDLKLERNKKNKIVNRYCDGNACKRFVKYFKL